MGCAVETNTASGKGGWSYIVCIAHHQRYEVRCTSMQGLSFKCVALCIPKFTIYIKNLSMEMFGLDIPAEFLNRFASQNR